MAYRIEVESRHTAKVPCRVIPGVCAIGTVGSMRALGEVIEEIADRLQVGGDYDQKNGFYVVQFESDTSADLVAGAAREFIAWLEGREDFVSQ